MIKIYGSSLCHDCRECKANLDFHQVETEFTDITKSLKNLKEFLAMRDSLPVFDPCRESQGIGIPALVLEDGTVTLDWEGVLKDRGLEIVYRETRVSSCTKNRNNC